MGVGGCSLLEPDGVFALGTKCALSSTTNFPSKKTRSLPLTCCGSTLMRRLPSKKWISKTNLCQSDQPSCIQDLYWTFYYCSQNDWLLLILLLRIIVPYVGSAVSCSTVSCSVSCSICRPVSIPIRISQSDTNDWSVAKIVVVA